MRRDYSQTLTRPRGGQGRRIALAVLTTALLLGTASCDRYRDKLHAHDGVFFKARSSAVDKKVSRADFTATIWAVSQSLKGAREAGRYEGTKYCIAQYGSSMVKWAVGPDTPTEQLTIVEDTLTFSGRCDP